MEGRGISFLLHPGLSGTKCPSIPSPVSAKQFRSFFLSLSRRRTYPVSRFRSLDERASVVRERRLRSWHDLIGTGGERLRKTPHPGALSLLLFFCLAALVFPFIPVAAAEEPVSIGVLLPLSGPEGQPIYDALSLARDQINAGGGIGGRPVQLVFRDTRTGNLTAYARYLAEDPDIRVIIGPYTSDDLFQVADLFIQKYKVLISPTASSDDIFRAYANDGSVWRTIANDGDLISVMMQQISNHGGSKVALLTVNSSYGKTFYDWIPYWAIEQGVEITSAEEYTRGEEIPGAIARLSEGHPDFVVFVHSGESGEMSEAMMAISGLTNPPRLYLVYPDIDPEGRIWERADPDTLRFLLDSGLWKIDTVSTLSTRIPDGTLLVMAKPFDEVFLAEYIRGAKGNTTAYVPEAYDALLAGAQVMARFITHPDRSPKSAAMTVLTNQTGVLLPRTPEGIQEGLAMILQDELPTLTGATGPLTFHPEGCDRLLPWYETYRMESGELLADPVPYRKKGKNPIESGGKMEPGDSISEPGTVPPEDFWAVIGALSQDWPNYRHQADALTMYRMIRSQGVPDDHIILLIYDDIPTHGKNPKQGEVYHSPSGEEVRKEAVPDVTGEQVNRERFISILSGNEPLPDGQNLRSGENSTVFVYLSSHGSQNGSLVMGEGNEVLSPDDLASVFDEMKDTKRFGRMLVILESCFSGAVASRVSTEGVTVMTASAADETSKAAVYDSGLSSWISDEFSNQLISLQRREEPPGTLRHLYQDLYYSVRSSHPMISQNSSSLDLPLSTFFGGNT